MNAMNRVHRIALAFVCIVPGLLLAAPQAQDTTTEIKRTLEARYPNMKVVDVRPAPIPTLYEVFTGKSIVYTDKAADYLIQGSLFDTRSKKDLTDDHVNARNAIKFDSLPFDQAIKIVKGNGTRRLAIFSDPDCPYCRRLEEEMKTVTDMTVYLFLLPLTNIHPNAERHAKAIWCSPDSANVWSTWMLANREPKDATCDGDPVSVLHQLAERLNVSGTPTLYFENGSRYTGAMSTAELEEHLTKARSSG